jgi:hypothetical protein
MEILMQYVGAIMAAVLAAAGIPSALFGYYLRKIEKRRADEEAARKKYELYQVKMLTATACLCEANAIALQNGKCNGETHRALDHLKEVKHDQRDFLVAQGIDHLF